MADDESTFSGAALLFSRRMDRGHGGQQAARRLAKHFSGGSSTQLLPSDSSRGNKAPLNLVSPTLPRTYAVRPHKTFFHFASSLQHGKIRAEPIQRETGGWLSEHCEGIAREMGSGGQRKGGWVWTDQLGVPAGDSSTQHNNRDKKVPPATADYHLHSPTQTHAPSQSLANGGMHWGSGNAISHSVGVGTNLAAESLEGSSLQRWGTASDYSHFVMVCQSEVSHPWAKR